MYKPKDEVEIPKGIINTTSMSNTKKINNTLKNFKEKAIRDVVKGSKPQSKEEDVSKGEL